MSKAKRYYTTLHCEVIRTTEKAVLVQLENGDEHWLPRSECDNGDAIDVGDDAIDVADWLLHNRGIEV